ncbi:MAG: hypothetical protein ACKO5K_09015 [Armatimonadota bacterium]
MMRQRDLPPEEQSELFRLADEMQRADREADQESRASADAAAELGVAPEYLERATAEMHARRLEKIARNRARNRWIAIAVVVLAVGGMFAGMRGASVRSTTPAPPAATATALPLDSAAIRPGSQGITLQRTGEGVTLEIDRSGPAASAGTFANVAIPLPAGAPRRKIEVTLRGEGVGSFRADLENGDVRWKGANEILPAGSSRVVIDSSQMLRQTRRAGKWRKTAWASPESAKQVVLKFGDTVNAPGARGKVVVDRIEVR